MNLCWRESDGSMTITMTFFVAWSYSVWESWFATDPWGCFDGRLTSDCPSAFASLECSFRGGLFTLILILFGKRPRTLGQGSLMIYKTYVDDLPLFLLKTINLRMAFMYEWKLDLNMSTWISNLKFPQCWYRSASFEDCALFMSPLILFCFDWSDFFQITNFYTTIPSKYSNVTGM